MAVSDSSESTSRDLVRLMVRLSEQYLSSQRKREAKSGSSETPCTAEWTGDDDDYFLTGGVRPSSKRFKAAETPSKRFEPVTMEYSRPSKRIKAAETNAGISARWIPDELLMAIFRNIPAARDRSICASVCKRWLVLQAKISRRHFQQSCSEESEGVVSQVAPDEKLGISADWKLEKQPEKQPLWAIGELSRSLEKAAATDVGLQSIAVGTGALGGLGKLAIRSSKCVTDEGLSAIGTCCNALTSLILSDCPNIGDVSLEAIGRGCRLLENLEIVKCRKVGDLGLVAIAAGCLRLTKLSLESCDGIGSCGLKAIGDNCSNLLKLNIVKCPKVGNTGIIAVVKGCKSLRELKLEKIRIGDKSMPHIRKHCRSITKLVLSGLDKVTQEGFEAISRLISVRVLVLNGCVGVTDDFLASFGATSRQLKVLRLIDCDQVSDYGLQLVVNGCRSLEGLHIEKCNGVTYVGLQTCLVAVSSTLKKLNISKCPGIQDSALPQLLLGSCNALTSLDVTHCEGIGDRCLGILPGIFPSLEHVNFTGMTSLSDEGLSRFVDDIGGKLLSLNLRECVNLTDEAMFAVGRICRGLQSLVLDGCLRVTDRSIGFVTSQCSGIQDLDISRCSIGDSGVLRIVCSIGPCLKTFSLAGCQQVTEESLVVIYKMCDSLSTLNLKNCTGFTASALEKLGPELRRRCNIHFP